MSTTSSNLAAALAGNLAAGWRLAFGQPLRLADIRASAGVVIATAVGYGCIVLLAARLAAGAASLFWVWGLVAELARTQVWLAALVLACWCVHALHDTARLGVVLLNALLPVAVLGHGSALLAGALAGDAYAPQGDLWRASVVAWQVLLFARALALVPRAARHRRLAALGSYVGALLAMALWLPRASPFYRPEPLPPPVIDVEQVYYHQQALLEDQFAALTAPVPGRVDVYFVAVAPFAGQDVFVREVRAARAIVERRLALAGHTVTLVNHADTQDTLPLANLPNLRRTLDHLGHLIDREEDVVFVYLTSHGSDDATLAAEFSAIAPNDIHGADLRDALDAAGIRWRVVVISACYSGSFVDALRSATTLLVTAAAADRSSFGCSNDNDWTYFGEAFFAGALGETTDLVDAAHLARRAIARREAAEGLEPSRPQVVVGARIAAQLARWHRELEAAR